ncbi:MAG: TatD family hydrolase [Candidatus Eremiobacteraeota bacterium]|nr:TatD family hydrolase [Candidatus Eremiobacteraeota bacterium]MBV8354367.1 TatD family hydrolase [Candidatus Eremiobacteraeota bacterium]
MIDTHAHVHDPAFDEDRATVVARAKANGVTQIVTVGCDLRDSERALAAACTFDLAWTLGVHPHEAKNAPADLAAAFDAQLAGVERRPLAIGETGLDFYYDYSPRDVQRRVFEAQLDYARDLSLPLVFHLRDAFEDFVAIMRRRKFAGMRAVVHCFTGDSAQARLLTGEFGLFLGIGGVATFKTAEPLREAVRAVGIDAIVFETDAPYLAPVPERGKRNEPAFVRHTAAHVAQLLGLPLDDAVAAADRNAHAVFGPF